jgi:hypothetical protein
MGHKTRIMYIENKGGEVKNFGSYEESFPASLTGPGRIGRVVFSKTGHSLTYGGHEFSKAKGFKANYHCDTGEWYWISGPKKRGGDALYATNTPTEIDEDVREEYWTTIRSQPDRRAEAKTI